MRLLRAFLRDLRDTGAAVNTSRPGIWDFAKVALLPGMVMLGSVLEFVKRILEQIPGFSYFEPVLAPASLVVASLGVIGAKEVLPPLESDVVPPGLVKARQYYRFPTAVRNGAKIALPLFAAAFAAKAWQLVPNGLVGRTVVAGYVCSAPSQNPMQSALVEALDRAGAVVSERAEESDDTGFFMLDLRRFGQHPATLRIVTRDCGTVVVSAQSSGQAGEGCGGVGAGIPRPVPSRVWTVPCPK